MGSFIYFLNRIHASDAHNNCIRQRLFTHTQTHIEYDLINIFIK